MTLIENSGGKSAADTAQLLGISTTKVERTRSLLNHADADTIDDVKKRKKSINKACNEVRKKRKEKSENRKSDNHSEPDQPQSAIDEGIAPDEASGYDEHNLTVSLAPGQYRALRELGDSIQYHIEMAIDMYLQFAGSATDVFADYDE